MTSQLNILEKLTENFVELNEDIETIKNEIADHYKTNQEFVDEIKDFFNKIKNKNIGSNQYFFLCLRNL